jgi:hypothetical protein
MTNEEKANLYGHLLNEHTKIGNRIQEIKGQNIEPNKSDIQKIKDLESIQIRIMRDINRLLS